MLLRPLSHGLAVTERFLYIYAPYCPGAGSFPASAYTYMLLCAAPYGFIPPAEPVGDPR